MAYLLALDQGTTSSRSVVFRDDGTIVGVGQREFTQHYPRPGWVEHDAEEIWATQAATVTEALARARVKASDIAAIGVTNQRETTVVWDRESGEPIAPAIVWQDRRTAGMCERLREDGLEPMVHERTGLLLDAYFSGTKVAWLLDNAAGARERAERGELAFGTIDSWLVWKMTGGEKHVTDATNACRTLLYDIERGAWDDDLLEAFGVPRSMLPEVVDSCGEIGRVSEGFETVRAPIAALVGDQQAATVGQACFEPGLAKNTYGTGCFLLMHTGEEARRSEHRLLSSVAWQRDGKRLYCMEGSVFIGGAIVQWLRDGLGIIRKASEVEELASSVEDSGGVVLVPALTGLGAPHWDPHARGAILGITRGTTAAHIARAALEGLAFEIADLAKAMTSDAGHEIEELRVDGGAAANDLLLQMQADLLQRPVVRPTVLETTALGAAYLAGLATGVYGSLEDIASNWKEDRRFEPRISEGDSERRRARWREAVERSKGWARDDSETP